MTMRGVVGDDDFLADGGEAYAEVAVLGEAVGVPAAGFAQDGGADEDGVAAERNESFLRVQVEAGAEPEEVLQAVAQAVPAGVEVDELHSALDDVGAGGAEGVVDVGEEFGVDLVLGVEDPDDVAAAVRQRRVHGLRFVLLLVGVDDDADARVAGGGLFGDGGRLRVVVADDDDDLEVGVGGLQQPLDGVVQHGLFVACGQQQ
ncbi:hypothetical protein GCM10020256_27280 [Streptomyces thermocoprophilus]